MTGYKFYKLIFALLAVTSLRGCNVVGEEVPQEVERQSPRPGSGNLSVNGDKPAKKQGWLKKISDGINKQVKSHWESAGPSDATDGSSSATHDTEDSKLVDDNVSLNGDETAKMGNWLKKISDGINKQVKSHWGSAAAPIFHRTSELAKECDDEHDQVSVTESTVEQPSEQAEAPSSEQPLEEPSEQTEEQSSEHGD
ncbi:uncharacterized protein BXIN_1982 [Babesia sp. Xinjiang]|uniref:uncharacterized protein n=1 Tax=Babesia sp. Xinjiang TaxID=462227 RepID=UPI000A24781C|nr:uncharacterized protein BXIN_1982 [Babesia sp. Xinjiang]ORM40363.1 hypothetical protein BXIN_1982 [Babesia sp. Xinjiang]